ncbi:MAG: GntR family transcriptional regulator [Sphingobacteriaceae bacterium]|nr:MAG: GntR family transcriptional regulator [Sphingobacteriaceae bacterium]
MKNLLKVLTVDEYSVTPKYVQIVNGFKAAIENGHIQKDEMLPSLNDLSCGLEISKNTIERVYSELKKLGIIGSVPGKGVFVLNTEFKKPFKILLLFNKLSSHKKIMYDSLVQQLGTNAAIDFYIYNNDYYLFKRILTEKIKSDYSKFVIVPHFLDHEDIAYDVINEIPKDKLILVDKLVPKITGHFAAVYEDFEVDIFGALSKLLHRLANYHTIKIIFPENTYHSKGIIKGFRNFCVTYGFDYEIIDCLDFCEINTGTVYINLMEDDLAKLIFKILSRNFIIGEDVGVISYNETDIKSLILDGLTTISTDFSLLGIKTAEMILSNNREHFAVPFTVNERKSL